MKNKKKLFETFESKNTNGRFLKFAFDMIESKAWKQLDNTSIFLYFTLKMKFTRYKDGTTNVNNISMPKSEYSKFMTQRTFGKHIDQLIEFGFIKVILCRYNLRLCTIYGFSSMWTNFGTDKFCILLKDKRLVKKKLKI